MKIKIVLKHWAKTACGESKCWEFNWSSFLQTQSCSCNDQHFGNDFRKWIYLTWEWNSIQLKLFYIQKLILSQYFCKNLLVAINPFYFDKDFSFFPNCFTLLICQLSCVILKDSFFSFFLLCSNKRKMEDIRLSRICLCYNVNDTNCFFSCCWTGILKMCGCWCGSFSDKYRNWNKSLYMMIQNMVLWNYLI